MQLDKLKDWGGLITRWMLLFAAVIIGWSNLENRVTNLEADTVGTPALLLEIKQDLAVIKNDISWLKENMPKNDNQ
jgi:hypothetical protein